MDSRVKGHTLNPNPSPNTSPRVNPKPARRLGRGLEADRLEAAYKAQKKAPKSGVEAAVPGKGKPNPSYYATPMPNHHLSGSGTVSPCPPQAPLKPLTGYEDLPPSNPLFFSNCLL